MGFDQAAGVGGEFQGLDYIDIAYSFPLFAFPPGLLGEFEDAVDGLAAYAGFAVGEVVLLGGQEAAEVAALAEVDGVVPLIAVAAGGPSFGFGEGVGLVDGAVDGFAAVGGEGFEDNGDAGIVGVGNGGGGLPVVTVPGDGAGGGLGRGYIEQVLVEWVVRNWTG